MKLYVGVPCWVPFWPDFTGFLPSFHSVPSFVRTLGSVGRRRRFRFFFVFLSIRLISNDAMLNDSVAVVSFVFLFLVSFLFCFWGSVSVFGDTTWFYRVFFFFCFCLLIFFGDRFLFFFIRSTISFLFISGISSLFFCFFHWRKLARRSFFPCCSCSFDCRLAILKKIFANRNKKNSQIFSEMNRLLFSSDWTIFSIRLNDICLPSFTGFSPFTGFYLVLLGFTKIYWVLLGFT